MLFPVSTEALLTPMAAAGEDNNNNALPNLAAMLIVGVAQLSPHPLFFKWPLVFHHLFSLMCFRLSLL